MTAIITKNWTLMLDEDKNILVFTVPNDLAGTRLDKALPTLVPERSRSFLQELVKEGLVLVDGEAREPRTKLLGGERLEIRMRETKEALAFEPEDVPFEVVYEDETIIVVNKRAGLVVHPAGGNWTGTLLNGLLFRYPELRTIPRAGIVHRLDKDTTGLMVVARTSLAQTDLVRQLQERTVKRTYRAITEGVVPYDGTISTLIGRHPGNRKKMAVLKEGGKEAITHVKVLERFHNNSYIECVLETGRTHQIRVHMKEAGHPLVGDPLYGARRSLASPNIKALAHELGRQALHAYRLRLRHPQSKENMEFEAPLPEDMLALLHELRFATGRDVPETYLEDKFGRNPDGTIALPPHEDDDDDWDDEWGEFDDDDDDGFDDVEVIYTRE